MPGARCRRLSCNQKFGKVLTMVNIIGGTRFLKVLEQMAAGVQEASEVDIGFLEGANYPDGTPVALVAAVQEFGAPRRNIPPRPFFRTMITEKSPEWGPAIGALLVHNNYNASRTLGQVGVAIEGQLQESISGFSGAPLSPKTVAAKGFDKALIDTGVMFRSVSSVVK